MGQKTHNVFGGTLNLAQLQLLTHRIELKWVNNVTAEWSKDQRPNNYTSSEHTRLLRAQECGFESSSGSVCTLHVLLQRLTAHPHLIRTMDAVQAVSECMMRCTRLNHC